MEAPSQEAAGAAHLHWLVSLPAALAVSPAAAAARPGCAVLLQMPALLGFVKKRGLAYYLKDAGGGYMQAAVEAQQLPAGAAHVAPGGQLLLTVPAAQGDYEAPVGGPTPAPLARPACPPACSRGCASARCPPPAGRWGARGAARLTRPPPPAPAAACRALGAGCWRARRTCLRAPGASSRRRARAPPPGPLTTTPGPQVWPWRRQHAPQRCRSHPSPGATPLQGSRCPQYSPACARQRSTHASRPAAACAWRFAAAAMGVQLVAQGSAGQRRRPVPLPRPPPPAAPPPLQAT
jgi:hypothetical protein